MPDCEQIQFLCGRSSPRPTNPAHPLQTDNHPGFLFHRSQSLLRSLTSVTLPTHALAHFNHSFACPASFDRPLVHFNHTSYSCACPAPFIRSPTQSQAHQQKIAAAALLSIYLQRNALFVFFSFHFSSIRLNLVSSFLSIYPFPLIPLFLFSLLS